MAYAQPALKRATFGARKSRRFPAFEAASHFAIHVLGRDQQALAERFAERHLRAGFHGLEYGHGLGDAPLFEDCAALFECRHAAGYDGGDHLIVVGEVLRLTMRDVPPLIYYRGGYTGLAGSTVA